MNREKFIAIAGGTIIAAVTTSYLLSDKSNLSRADIKPTDENNTTLQPDEKEILLLASLAPSGHNLRVGYLKNYPQPVSLRRPIDWFVRK